MEYILFFYLGLIFGSLVPTVTKIEGDNLYCKFFCCTNCKKKFSTIYLLPLLSIFLRNCRYCRHKINFQFAFVQIITAAIFVLIYQKYGVNISAFLFMLLAVCLVTMSVVDLRHCMVPDLLQLLVAGLGILYVIFSNNFIRLLNVFLVFFIFFIIAYLFKYFAKKEVIGTADIILFSLASFFLS